MVKKMNLRNLVAIADSAKIQKSSVKNLQRIRRPSKRVMDAKTVRMDPRYLKFKQKIKDELLQTESTDEALNVILENMDVVGPEQAITAGVEIIAEVVDELQNAVDEMSKDEDETSEDVDEVEDSAKKLPPRMMKGKGQLQNNTTQK